MVPSVSFLTDGSVKGYEKMFVIAGLGNPGKKYEKTRHNMGFLVIDRIAEKCGIDVSRIKHRALVGDGIISGRKVLLVKPQTYIDGYKIQGYGDHCLHLALVIDFSNSYVSNIHL